MIIFAYGTLKCLLGKTFRTILRIFYRYRPRFHTETRRAVKFPQDGKKGSDLFRSLTVRICPLKD
ncbi:hypothetical protein VL20_4529 [Microcystis panniformis FACHB-1757]|uniref:Uncharacterized protein n=1 Tax=Microcystis panniformis FACHB-1757 TaxID=1638788 RepID=A0A0K1S619_9CHRO|nr:hypothetical protein VL20_4529 [Microcystis panniformis FACHB-1757]